MEEEPLTVEEVEKIADLSRLNFTPEELLRFVDQFQKILTHCAQLEMLPTDDVEPTYHAFAEELTTTMSEDRVGTSFSSEQSLANAPDAAEEYFGVPTVIE